MEDRDIKVNRILTIYSMLIQKEKVNKKQLADKFKVNEKTIQRDIDDIRAYFSNNIDSLGTKEINYNRAKKSYEILGEWSELVKEDVLAISKILLESRAFCKEEINHLIKSLSSHLKNEDIKYVKDLIGNELFNYAPVKHNTRLLTKIWDISNAIRKNYMLEISYVKMNGDTVQKSIKPVAIIFSEYYFYVISVSEKYNGPVVYRIDRIKEHRWLNERFIIPNSLRFEDGEFRKRVQFMYTGDLMKVKFKYTGSSLEAVLDRLPTAKSIEGQDGKYIIEAEVYGEGIKMWMLSQGKNIEVLEPSTLRTEMIKEVQGMVNIYKNQ